MTSFRGKTVLVTGASSGLGRATALQFAREGARLIIAARREKELSDVRREIEALGGECLAVPTDVTVEEQVIHLFAAGEVAFGPVHIVVNNAGRGLRARLHEIEYDDWQSVLHSNLTSVYLCTRIAAKAMVEAGTRGHIITVGSIAGLIAIPGFSAYNAAKHGVTGFHRAVKWELRRVGIKASIIYPWRIDTAFYDRYPKRPGRGQMLAARDVARYLTAVASRSFWRRLAVRLQLLALRLYYPLRYLWPGVRRPR
jgi:NAD(P)-dependent dehydrogenase (short-subunit alcohol dehydrogenase family)